MLAPSLTRYPHGITAVDVDYVRPGLAAAHIIVHQGRAAFVDVGTSLSTPLLLAALDELGVGREAVDYVFLTHVHLDHAGGAGRLMQELPHARAVLHPRGGPHLIDPKKLIVASKAVYGEERYRALYGEIVPLPAARVIVTSDGERLSLAGRPFEAIHTPGHALHHQCFVDLAGDEAGPAIFTGDTFGLSYRELDTARGPFVVPTTTPSQFDPEQLLASIDRILSYRPAALYLTHYGRVTDLARLGAELKEQVRELTELARLGSSVSTQATLASEIRSLWWKRARRHGCTLSDDELETVLGGDAELNAQGLVSWQERQRRTG